MLHKLLLVIKIYIVNKQENNKSVQVYRSSRTKNKQTNKHPVSCLQFSGCLAPNFGSVITSPPPPSFPSNTHLYKSLSWPHFRHSNTPLQVFVMATLQTLQHTSTGFCHGHTSDTPTHLYRFLSWPHFRHSNTPLQAFVMATLQTLQHTSTGFCHGHTSDTPTHTSTSSGHGHTSDTPMHTSTSSGHGHTSDAPTHLYRSLS